MKINNLMPDDGWQKICLCCGKPFQTKNRKKKFCSPYHKHIYHYDQYLINMRNKLEIERLFKMSYAAIKTCYERGWYEVVPEVLMILGFKREATPVTGTYKGEKAIFYVDFALVASSNNKIKIIKMSTWRNSKI